ncbi:hypothetical protein O6H91_13G059100 [Diphasiastrum complanatum]|uniref:Uncharacterized protein n=2 Tax=Diphasiastrum complanatum TaxID=34168 RepID=A0ACC2BVN7_DIPCM|nr:hypothetical protein O6H91_13G015400 [Diphasiastrum complanatum]KAJ7533663.1 hypothetical protein O6H91_13G059100 [Diphasiastrum complanatum]
MCLNHLCESIDTDGLVTINGHLHLGKSHEMAIGNGLNRWPNFHNITHCHPHSGRHNVVDYLMGSVAFISYIIDLFITPIALFVHSPHISSWLNNGSSPPYVPPLFRGLC